MQKAKIAILGFGREGKSLLRFLRSRRLTQTGTQTYAEEIWVLDNNPDANLGIDPNEINGVQWQLGPTYLNNLTRFHTIFRSPGIPYTLPQLVKAKQKGVRISSATKLFFEEIKKTEPRTPMLIGITGSKGKGTTASLLYEILKESGFRVLLAGNIGQPMLDILPEAGQSECVILELSSFQLQDLQVSPQIAVVLDIFPEHLDAHKNLREYLTAKMRIAKYQTNRDRIFYFIDNEGSMQVAMKSLAQKTGVNPHEQGIRKNYEMAAAVARFLECPETIIERTIRNFKGLPHRLELVRTLELPAQRHSNILQNVGMSFYNDSAATNPYATAAAIRSFQNPLILIAGGRDKNLDYAPLKIAISESNYIARVILLGENKEKIRTELEKIKERRIEISECKDLKSAVTLAYKTAVKLMNSQTHQLVTVLFSPASTSFDMFKNYEERGEVFTKIVNALKANE